MENTNYGIAEAPLPPGLEKNADLLTDGVAAARRLLSSPRVSTGLNALKGALFGHTDDALRSMGNLGDIRKVVTRSGWTIPDWNRAITIGESVIPGKKLLGDGLTHSIETAGSNLDKWWNPAGWYTGGSAGYNTLKNRYLQGGLFGRGGIAHGTFSVNPRLGYNFSDLKAGRRLLPSLNGSTNPLKWDTGSIAGTAGGGLREAAKIGFGVGIPASAVYGALNPEEGDPRGLGQRLGGAIGSAVGTYASMPLGIASWLPSTVAPLITEDKNMLDAAEALTPWGAGSYIGEQLGSLGNRKTFDPEEYQKQKYLRELEESNRLQQAALASRRLRTQESYPDLPPDLARRYYQYNANINLPYRSNVYYGINRDAYAPTSIPRNLYLDYRLPSGLNYP